MEKHATERIELLFRKSLTTNEMSFEWVRRELRELTERYVKEFSHHNNILATKNHALLLIAEMLHYKLVVLIAQQSEEGGI